jgi:hypothetical protein
MLHVVNVDDAAGLQKCKLGDPSLQVLRIRQAAVVLSSSRR